MTLYGELTPAPACAGQHWLMTLRLRPVHGQLNDGGFDSQRYALAQHRPLSGGLLQLPRWIPAAARPLPGVVDPASGALSLACGDAGIRDGERLTLPTAIKVLMQNTGTSHLMAISGLHIALAASLIVLPAARRAVYSPGPLDRLAVAAAGRGWPAPSAMPG